VLCMAPVTAAAPAGDARCYALRAPSPTLLLLLLQVGGGRGGGRTSVACNKQWNRGTGEPLTADQPI
jgi:hypothetical protein